MRITKLSLTAFGRFHGRTVRLEPGLNIVYGQNEAGKTTIGKFVLGMLYGFKRKGQRRDYTEDALKYRPWEGADYRGALTYAVDRLGHSFRVERVFEPQREEVHIYDDVTGADLTDRFPMDRRKEILFVEEQLKLPEEVFRSTAWVGQLEVGKLEMGRELVARVANMQESGRDDLSVRGALRTLEDRMREIGTERAPTRPYARVSRLVADKQAELERALAAREESRGWEGALTEIRASLTDIDADLEQLAQRLDWALYASAEEQLSRAMQSISAARDARARATELQRYRDFPVREKDRLIHLSAEAAALETSVVRQRARLAELNAQVAELAGEAERYPGMAADAASEVEVGLQLIRSGAERLPALREEVARLTEAVAQVDESITPLKTTVEQGAAVLAQLDLLEQELTSLRSRQSAPAAITPRPRTAGSGAGWVALVAGVVCAAAAAGVVVRGGGVLGWLAWPAAASLGLIAVGLFVLFAIARKRAPVAAPQGEPATDPVQELARLEGERTRLLEGVGVASPSEIRSRTMRYEQLLVRREGQQARLEAVQSDLSRVQEEVTQRKQRLARILARGLSLTPQELAAESDAVGRFRKVQADYAELRQKQEIGRREIGELSGRVQEQEASLARLRADMQAMLAEAQVESVNAFTDGCARHEAWAKAAGEAEALEAALRSTLGGENPEAVQMQVERLRQRTRGARPADPLDAGQIQADIRRLEGRRSELTNRASDLAARIETALRDLADTADIQREIAQLEEERRSYDAELAALDLAARTIAEVSTQIHREFAPKLHSAMGQIIAGITGGKYRQVKIDEELAMRAVTADDRTVDLLTLSGGTVDQFYFGLRVALLDLISEGQEKCPLILDDPFVQYDEQRLRNAMQFLSGLAEDRQIILMTCHLREVRAARAVAEVVNVIDLSDEQVVDATL